MDGIKIIQKQLKTAPTTAGVYRMLNSDDEVLYVGKAKNLQKRLTNYTKPERMVKRIRKMVFETVKLILVETPTETEALLLEINLIKNLKPKYNIIFKDDKSYPYIIITSEKFPRIMSGRGIKNTNKNHASVFGPYPGADSVYRTIDMLEKTFHLRTCNTSTFNNRTRPCLKYDIKRCSAPCVNKISESNYQQSIKEASQFLSGKGNNLQKIIQQRMVSASNEKRYEDAAIERDKLKTLTHIQTKGKTLSQGLKNADVLAVHTISNDVCIQGFFYRNNQHIGNRTWFEKNMENFTSEQILKAFISQHYNSDNKPSEIICSHKPEDLQLLKSLIDINIVTPQKGHKKDIINQALHNAEQALVRKQSQSASWKNRLACFKSILKTPHQIKSIETFDISNISGTNAVASMVVADETGMNKKKYRKFAVKTKNTPDDYAMMAEVLTRRYANPKIPYPDVVMVDGGRGHLTTLINVFKKIKFDNGAKKPILCAISKGKERDKGYEKIWQEGAEKPLPIEFNSPLIFVLQQIRDESHRFAITFHRQKRSKNTIKSALDSISGIGAKRKKALLLHFGSVNEIKKATIGEISRAEGISKKIAEIIYDGLHG
jgi:excinuclease ABC subunit C